MNQNMFCNIETLRNESDVEQLFIMPLLTFLKIRKEFIRTKDKLESYYIGKGKRKKQYKPDYVIYIHGIPVLIIEAKSPNEKLKDRYFNEAQLYAHELNKQYPPNTNPAKYCLTTNGNATYLHHWDYKNEILQINFCDYSIGSIKLSFLKKYLFVKVLEKEALSCFKKIKGDLSFDKFNRYLSKIIEDTGALDKIYIPLNANIYMPKKPSCIRGWRGIIEEDLFVKPISDQENLLECLKEQNQLIVLGEAGAGKTTTLERFAYESAKSILEKRQGARIPVIISVNAFSKKKDREDLISFICDILSINPEQYYQLLFSGKLSIIIDGLNETSKIKREQIVSYIQDLIRKEDFKENQVIVATRKDSFYPYYDVLEIPTIEILKLDDMNIKEYLKKRLGGESEKCFDKLKLKGLLELVRNPYLLSIMTYVYKKEDEKSLSNRGLLLKEFVNGLIEWEVQKTGEEELKEIIFKMLSCFAYFSIENNDIGKINSSVAIELLQKCYMMLNIPQEIILKMIPLLEIQNRILCTGILQEKNGYWEFHHQLIQEYLASEELYRRVYLNINKYEDYLKEIKWIQVVYNAIGIIQIQEARKIIESLIDKNIFIAADLWKYASNPELNDFEPIFIYKLSRIVENWRDDEISCMQAIRALGRIGTYKANQVIIKILNEFNDYSHEQRGILFVAAEIASIFQVNEAIDHLIRLSKNESANRFPQKYTSCLASIRSNILEDRLINELKNCIEMRIRPSWSIIYLLGKLRTRKALSNLLKLLDESYLERDDHIFSYISYSIYSIDSNIIEEELEKILNSDPEDDWVDKIIYIIGELKLYRFIPRLIDTLKKECDKRGNILAYNAFSALEKMGNLDPYLDQLLEMLHSDNNYLRSYSLLLFNGNTSCNAFPEAIKMIKSSDKFVIRAAYDVIIKSKDQKENVIKYIVSDLRTGTPYRKELAAIACGKLEIFDAKSEMLDFVKEVYQKLLGLLADKDKNKKEISNLEMTLRQLIISLGEIKAEESVEFLIKILAEYPSFIFGDCIGKSIKNIESLRYIERLEKLLKVDDIRWWIAPCVSDILIELSPSNKLEEFALNLLGTLEFQNINQACKLVKRLFHKNRIINKMFQIVEPLFDNSDFSSLFQIVDTLTEVCDISYIRKAEILKKASKKYISSIGKHILYNLYVSAGLFPPPQYEIKDG